jgi:DNA-binding MarR family transcriptional regulator
LSSTNTAETILKLLPLLNKKFIRSMNLELRTILTSMQINVLVVLVEKKATMTELSNEILIPKQQMTPLIDKLVSEGFVQREYDAIDRRIIRISITPLGLDILVKIKEKALAVLETKLKKLDQNDLLCLNKALTDICKIINKIT